MLVALLGRRHDPAELALEAVDGGAQTPGIDEIVVGLAIEIGDRRLELDEFIKHVAIYELMFGMSIYFQQIYIHGRPPCKATEPAWVTPSQSFPLDLHSLPMARRRLKLIFGPSLVKEPVIYQVGRKFEIVTNIRRADVTRDQGWVLLEVSGEPEELDRGVEYLESRGVKVEPAEGDLVE